MRNILFFTMIALLPFSVFAAEAVSTVTTEGANFSWLFTDYLVPAIGAVVGFILLQVANWLSKKTGLEKLVTQEQINKLVDKLLEEATNYAVSNLKDANWLKIQTKNEAVDFALHYASENGQELLKKAGLDSAKLQQKIEAKLLKHDTNPGQWTE